MQLNWLNEGTIVVVDVTVLEPCPYIGSCTALAEVANRRTLTLWKFPSIAWPSVPDPLKKKGDVGTACAPE